MNLYSDIHHLVLNAIAQLQQQGDLPADLPLNNVTIEPPRDALHGDMASNAAMVLAKAAGQAPRALAEKLADILRKDARIDAVDVAGPGFLNLGLNVQIWHTIIPAILDAEVDFGQSNMGKGKRINIEYVSTNPTGPLHVGHTRGAVFGDALANLLRFAGYDVTREYYINDGGAQIDTLARSVYLRYLQAHGQDVDFPDGSYPGDYLIAVGKALYDKVGDAYVNSDESVWLDELRLFSVDAMMDIIRADLAALGVHMDVFFSERSLYGTGRIEAAIAHLEDRGLIYVGTLPPPKGKLPDGWQAREQTLFKSTQYGDDVDRAVKKSDGSWAYFAPDIAYHYDKIERGFDALINVFGADHSGYVKRMTAAVKALSNDTVPVDIKIVQIVHLLKAGKQFKMSKRAGTFISLRDLIEKVGADVVRFVMLTRKNDAPLDFDFDRALEQSKDNPVFYVQYANARINSVLGKIDGIDMPDFGNLDQLNHSSELDVIKKLAQWPRIVELSAKHNEPHRIAFYLYELASHFHSLWNLGKSEEQLRFIQDENPTASAQKIALLRAVQYTLHSGLAIMGVQPIDEMR